MIRARMHDRWGLAIRVSDQPGWAWLLLDPNNRRHPAGWARDEDVSRDGGWRELLLLDTSDAAAPLLTDEVVRVWRGDERGTPLHESWPELAAALHCLDEVWAS